MRRVAIALLVLAVGCLLSALAAPPLLRVASPRAAVHATFLRDPATIVHSLYDRTSGPVPPDPWGRPYRVRPWAAADGARQPRRLSIFEAGQPPGRRPRPLYSTGPDGVDESGAGDDVHVDQLAGEALLACAALAWLREGLMAVTLTLLWWLAWLRPGRRRAAIEAAIVACMAAPLAASSAAAVWRFERDFGSSVKLQSPDALLLPPPLAVVGTLALGALVAAAAVRASTWRSGHGTMGEE